MGEGRRFILKTEVFITTLHSLKLSQILKNILKKLKISKNQNLNNFIIKGKTGGEYAW